MTYFIFSREQLKLRITLEKSIGNLYLPGEVVVKGKKRSFTEMTTDLSSLKFRDYVIVYQSADLSVEKYTEPKTVKGLVV